MSEAWDLVAELCDQARTHVLGAARAVRQKTGTSMAILLGVWFLMTLRYTYWAYDDHEVACRTAKKCRYDEYEDPEMQRAMDYTCIARQQVCDEFFFVRGPVMLVHDVYTPIRNAVSAMFWYGLWNYGITIVGAVVIAAVLIVLVSTAERFVAPVLGLAVSLLRRSAGARAVEARHED